MSGLSEPMPIGFWKDPVDHEFYLEWPEVREYVDPDWDPKEREIVAAYLSAGLVVGPHLPPFHKVRFSRAFLGFSNCKVCGCRNGSLEFTDDFYYWPEGYAHYLEKHLVKPPEHFVQHVLDEVRKATEGRTT